MSVEQNKETVRRGYAAFSSGDTETLMEIMRDDVVQHVPGSSKVSGAHKGPDAVLTMYGQLFELSEGSMQVELEDVLSDGGDRVISIHRSRVVKDGQEHVQREALLFTMIDGKVAEIQDFSADIELNDRLFS